MLWLKFSSKTPELRVGQENVCWSYPAGSDAPSALAVNVWPKFSGSTSH